MSKQGKIPDSHAPCPCGTGQLYQDCCALWEQAARNVESQLDEPIPLVLREVWLRMAQAMHAIEQLPPDTDIVAEMRKAFDDPEAEDRSKKHQRRNHRSRAGSGCGDKS